jgi:hypothetical protein
VTIVYNERIKLAANALDRASTACLAIGVLGPAVSFLYGVGPPNGAGLALGVGSLTWFGVAIGLHLRARKTLGGLK